MVCLQETKVEDFSVSMINEVMGPDFDYYFLPSSGASGGVLVGWRRDMWRGSNATIAVFSVTLLLSPIDGADVADCWLTSVYGPTDQSLKEPFLRELEGLATSCMGAWLI